MSLSKPNRPWYMASLDGLRESIVGVRRIEMRRCWNRAPITRSLAASAGAAPMQGKRSSEHHLREKLRHVAPPMDEEASICALIESRYAGCARLEAFAGIGAAMLAITQPLRRDHRVSRGPPRGGVLRNGRARPRPGAPRPAYPRRRATARDFGFVKLQRSPSPPRIRHRHRARAAGGYRRVADCP